MKNKLFSPARKEAGFTLVELLTVIVIIGILAAVAIPLYAAQKARAQDSQTISDVRNIAVQAETLLADKTKTFDDVTKANIEFASSKNASWNISGSNTLGGYCIVAKNEAGKEYKTDAKALKYDSKAGGVGRDGGACTGTNIPAPSGSTAVGSLVAYTPITFNASSNGQNGSIQTFSVTDTGVYKIEAYGAQGGSSSNGSNAYGTGGKGAYAAGTFSLTSGQSLNLSIGQQGLIIAYPNGYGAGGGGASGASLNGNPLVMAGGGGGTVGTIYSGAAGSTTTNPNITGASFTSIGSSGFGGLGNCGGGGGGLNSAGNSGHYGGNGGGGGFNAVGGTSPHGAHGGYGFGAGGAAGGWGSGGGGGYTGGSGGCDNSGSGTASSAGQGGGSYVAPSTTTTGVFNNTDKAQTGNGKVVITRIS